MAINYFWGCSQVNTQRKIDVVMNLMYNLPLAMLFSLLAEAINAGGVSWPAFGIDTLISYVLEMLIALFLPFSRWGHAAALKSGAKPGSPKFRAVTAAVTATLFAALMSLAMSFISCILTLHLPVTVWMAAWMRILFLFIAVAFVCAYFLVPVFIELAKKALHIPRSYNPFAPDGQKSDAER